tara:strand:+ start:3547 stop:4524 length:978 start_codon:yes stop_codon:yes gene_type:complete
MKSQRDVFISSLFKKAKEDKDIYLISVDMGAPSLDQWREELPDQFLAAGISEQNAINFAAGLSSAGKKVYVYFMASWVARCFEQIRYSCAMAENPITILGNGVALGYSPAGPAHNPTEDMCYMRSICGIEIYSPSNNSMVESLVDLTVEELKLRYIRLERNQAEEMSDAYRIGGMSTSFLKVGASIVKPGLSEPRHPSDPKICIMSSGYMLGRTCEAWEKLISSGYQASVYDVWRIKPINEKMLKEMVKEYDYIVTVEEQTISGAFGSAIIEALSDSGTKKDILRIGLPERYIFENGSRDYHIDNNGLSAADIYSKITNFVKEKE